MAVMVQERDYSKYLNPTQQKCALSSDSQTKQDVDVSAGFQVGPIEHGCDPSGTFQTVCLYCAVVIQSLWIAVAGINTREDAVLKLEA